MQNIVNVLANLFGISLNQLMTLAVLFDLVWSYLLIILVFVLFSEFSLRSFKVMKQLVVPFTCIQSRVNLVNLNNAPFTKTALVKSGCTWELKYKTSQTSENRQRKKGKKNIFGPPTPIQKACHHDTSQETHKFHKLFNRNNVKVSYSCMPNIRTNISLHSKKILEYRPPLVLDKCNCNNKNECPLNGECASCNILCKTKVNSNVRNCTEKLYKGRATRNHSTTSNTKRKTSSARSLRDQTWWWIQY